jgi:hypothetical protein
MTISESPETTESAPTGRRSGFCRWLHALPGWQFTGVLYLLRWAVILPLAWILSPFASAESFGEFPGNPWSYLFPFLVVAPVLETLIECSLLFWILHRVLKLSTKSPWPFVVVSGLAMVVAHPLVMPTIVFAFITVAFLAYVYFQFAPESHGKAFLHTTVFHAGINLTGWSMLMWAHYA